MDRGWEEETEGAALGSQWYARGPREVLGDCFLLESERCVLEGFLDEEALVLGFEY